MSELQEITRLQENLQLIRRMAGWTAKELGEKIGVTRQTINNLERLEKSETKPNEYKYKLTKTQYIAIRSVLDAEMRRLQENHNTDEERMLQSVLYYLVDHPEKLDASDMREFKKAATLVSSALATKSMDKEVVSKDWVKTMGKFLGDVLKTVAIGVWLAAVLGYAENKLFGKDD